MTRKYRPSNGTEGMIFIAEHCDLCWHDRHQECKVLAHTMFHQIGDQEYPEEWTYNDSGTPICTNYLSYDEHRASVKPRKKPEPDVKQGELFK